MITITIIPMVNQVTYLVNATRMADEDGRPREITFMTSKDKIATPSNILDRIEAAMLGRIHDGWWESVESPPPSETWKYHPNNHDIF